MFEKINTLQGERDVALKGAEDIEALCHAENRSPSANEAQEYDTYCDRFDVLTTEIDRAVKLEQMRTQTAMAAERRETDDIAASRRSRADGPPAAVETARIEVPHVDPSRLRAFHGPNAVENAYKSGMWLAAVVFRSDRARQWCTNNGLPEVRAASEGVNSEGGVLVPSIFDAAIIDLRDTYGVFRRNAKMVVMTSDHKVVPRRVSGLTAYAVGEAGTVTESEKVWNSVELTARKWAVLAKYSSEISEDAVINIAEDLADECAYAFAAKEDDSGWNGDGTSTYHGVYGAVAQLTANNGSWVGAVDAATGAHDTFAEIDATDLGTLMATLPEYAEPRAKFYCSRIAKGLVFDRLMAAAGGNTARDMAEKIQPTFLGYPIVLSAKMPTTTAAQDNECMLLFGDLALASTFGERRGTRIKVLTELYAATDQLGILATTRFDIKVHDLGDTSNAGPIVGLIGKA